MKNIFVCKKCSGKLEKMKGNALKCVLCNDISKEDTYLALSLMTNNGLSVTNSDGSMKSLKEIMDMLGENIKVMIDEEK